MRVTFFGVNQYERPYYEKLINKDWDLTFFKERLSPETKHLVAENSIVVCFVNDNINKEVLKYMKSKNVLGICTRSAGFNHIDVESAKKLDIDVYRVPAYSPTSVAEHCLSLIMTLNRKIHKSYNRVREHDFRLDGLVGRNLSDLTFGVIGTGRIGGRFVELIGGFQARVLVSDKEENSQIADLGEYVPQDELIRKSDVICLHVPLTDKTYHMISEKEFRLMKKDVILINTSRGGLVDTSELIKFLKKNKSALIGLDVYEEEEDIFFNDLSDHGVDDDELARLLTFPNVLLTSHQGFLTEKSLKNIADTTILNITRILDGTNSVLKENRVI